MNIIRLSVFLLCLCFFQGIGAQTKFSRVTFPVDEQQTRKDLAAAGLDLTHGHGKLSSFFTTFLQDFELARLDALGIRYTIDIADLSAHRKEGNHDTRGGLLECQDDIDNIAKPKDFELGTVGGFFSLSDVMDQLDVMQFKYPHLISVRKPIGTFKTWKNNSIYWVRISDQPETDENEPEILYTSLLHAREFVSVSQLIFYMWHLLENYDKDPMIKQILNHTELYFVPVVNPDGLNYNVQGYDDEDETFDRALRKNMRDNDGDGVFDIEKDGVDLNRNFGSHWAHDDEGSSGFPGDATYRGPYPFSEPETQAIRYLCMNHNFQVALNHHSYGNLLVYPWGYINEHTPDSTSFENYSQLLTNANRFVYGLGEETVGYTTNGDSDDWMYDSLGTFAMTPETGEPDDDFYPRKERIIDLCKTTLQMNLEAARLVNSLIEITDESPAFIEPGINTLDLDFNRYGLLDGEILISFNAISPEIQEVPESISFDLDKFEAHERNLDFLVDEHIPYGTTIRMEIVCQQGNYIFRDTISKVRADFSTLLKDAGDIKHWDTSNGMQWGNTEAAFKSGPVSIADSPDGLYGPNVNETIVLNEIIDLREATSAYAQFWARWDIEDHWDYVVFQASIDGENWDNLCGERSRLGGIFQLYEEPLYDGKQIPWVLETSDLQNYLGKQIRLRFMIVTDGYDFRDGFYFDDFSVVAINEKTVLTSDVDVSEFVVYPNPAESSFTIQMPDLEKPSIAIYNTLGQRIQSISSLEQKQYEVMASSWPAGLYQYVVYSKGTPVHNGLISLVH